MRYLLLLVAAAASPALPAQITVREHLIPRAGAFPHDPAVGADGIVWYTDQANSYIGRLDPVTEVRVVRRPPPAAASKERRGCQSGPAGDRGRRRGAGLAAYS